MFEGKKVKKCLSYKRYLKVIINTLDAVLGLRNLIIQVSTILLDICYEVPLFFLKH